MGVRAETTQSGASARRSDRRKPEPPRLTAAPPPRPHGESLKISEPQSTTTGRKGYAPRWWKLSCHRRPRLVSAGSPGRRRRAYYGPRGDIARFRRASRRIAAADATSSASSSWRSTRARARLPSARQASPRKRAEAGSILSAASSIAGRSGPERQRSASPLFGYQIGFWRTFAAGASVEFPRTRLSSSMGSLSDRSKRHSPDA